VNISTGVRNNYSLIYWKYLLAMRRYSAHGTYVSVPSTKDAHTLCKLWPYTDRRADNS